MNNSSSCSDISIDSLDENFKNKSVLKETQWEEHVETILVPFYEKDVLIKMPKFTKEKKIQEKNRNGKNNKAKKEMEPKSFLMNKNVQASKKSSYLDMFRKQFVSTYLCKKKHNDEIRSTSPQVGDTEIESIGDEGNKNESEFFNTEAYNEVYYEKLINQDMEFYLDQSLEELQFTEDLDFKTQDENIDNNLKSVSEVSQTRRHKRRATAQPMHNMKLGGLGPDTENIRPRLERARSLQRYSEKVRMENRLRIYKKSVEDDNKKSLERQTSAKKSESARHKPTKEDDQKNTYLINKTLKEKSSIIKSIYHGKTKSADVQHVNTKEKQTNNHDFLDKKIKPEQNINKSKTVKKCFPVKESIKADTNNKVTSKVKPNGKYQSNNNCKQEQKTQPMEISFFVNIDTGLRPSSALKILEEKHKHYQEKVKNITSVYINE